MKLYEYAAMLYEALENRAEDGVFTGHVTTVAANVGIPLAYVGQVTPLLTRAGSITYERRGGRAGPSIVRLVEPPTEEAVRKARPARHTRIVRLEQQLRDLAQRVTDLESERTSA